MQTCIYPETTHLCFVSWEEHFTERARYALVGTRQYVFQHDFPPALETATVDAQTDSVVTVLEVVLIGEVSKGSQMHHASKWEWEWESHIYSYACTYVQTYTCTRTHTHTPTNATQTHTHTHTHTMYICRYAHTYVRMYVHTYMCTFIYYV